MVGTPVSSIMDRNRASSGVSNFKFPHDVGPHGILMSFNKYRYQPTRRMIQSQPTRTGIGSVYLPLPRQLLDATNVRVNKTDIGNIGEIAAKGLADGQGDISALYNSVKSMIPSGSSVAHGISVLSQKAAGFNANFSEEFLDQINFLARQGVSGLFDSRALDIGSGAALNPKQALSFEGVNMREYDFDFELMPKSPEESETIRQISNFLHRNSLPGYRDLTFEGSSVLQRAFLEYPSTVDLFLIGVDPDHYLHFKPCMIQRFAANLTPTGGHQHAIMRGGKPAMVTFNLSFVELDIRTREDYEQGV